METDRIGLDVTRQTKFQTFWQVAKDVIIPEMETEILVTETLDVDSIKGLIQTDKIGIQVKTDQVDLHHEVILVETDPVLRIW